MLLEPTVQPRKQRRTSESLDDESRTGKDWEETSSGGLLRLNSTGGNNPCKGPEATVGGVWAETLGQRRAGA